VRLKQGAFLAVASIAMGTSCGRDVTPLGIVPRPVILQTSIATNPVNVLSAVVTVRAHHVDSAQVWFHVGGQKGDSITPATALSGDSATLDVLGLLPGSGYVLRVVAYGGLDVAVSDSLEFRTDTIPADLPHYTASGLDPSPGYVAFAAGRYGLVIDNTGRVVWYRYFADGAGLTFMAQPNGRFVARPSTPQPNDLEPWVEIDPAGNLTRTLGCVGGLQPRLHDLIAEPDGGYWIMCDETRTMDLSEQGGFTSARVTGTVVQHVGPGGELLFEWSAFDHFAITDLEPESRVGPTVNWTHGNAIDFDADGNLLVSFRSLGEITKIDVGSGGIMWRMGGLANQFSFQDTPLPAFSRQHSVRHTGSGGLLMLDNMGNPQESRAERYAVDQGARTARLIQSYASTPGVITTIGGGVQELPGGRTIVSFGTGGRVEEFDAQGAMVWQIEGNAGYVFRAQRIQSLYRPGMESTR